MRGTMLMLAALAGALVIATAPSGRSAPPRYEPPEVVSTAEPRYPVNAVTWGTVVLEVTIGESGAIESVRVVRDAPGFTDEALRTIKLWKFRAARLDGKPVRSALPVAFSFAQPAIWWQQRTKPPGD